MSTYPVCVIGSGLAGTWCAWALSKKGVAVTVVEKENAIANKASGNKAALACRYISEQQNSSSYGQYLSAGFPKLLDDLQDLSLRSEKITKIVNRCGAIQLLSTTRLKQLFHDSKALLPENCQRISKPEAETISGVELNSEAFYLPDALVCSPRELVNEMVVDSKSKIEIELNAAVTKLERRDSNWIAITSRCEFGPFSNVIIASAFEASSIKESDWLKLEAVRGETLLVSETLTSKKLKTALCFDGYITPAEENQHFVGASFKHGTFNAEPEPIEQLNILDRLEQNVSSLAELKSHPYTARVCFRTSTHDRLPYIGALSDFADLLSKAKEFQPGTNLQSKLSVRDLPGVFVSLGHGSKGLLSCPLAAEIISRMIVGEDLGEFGDIAKIVEPRRFVWKGLNKALG